MRDGPASLSSSRRAYASLYLPLPPYTSLYLPIPPHTSPYLPIPPYVSLNLLASQGGQGAGDDADSHPRPVQEGAAAGGASPQR